MTTLNLVKINFAFKTIAITFSGFLINFFDNFLPDSFRRHFHFGRCSDIIKSKSTNIEVPRSWFKHFYVFSTLYANIVLGLLYYRYFLNGKLPDVVSSILQFFMGSPLNSVVPAEHVFLALSIFIMHVSKRLYESLYITIFSDSKMTILYYIEGFTHYIGCVLSIFGESQYLISDNKIDLNWTRLTWLDYICVGVFLIATYLQYTSNVILSNLRKDKYGNIQKNQYKIPNGGLFEYISGPLQLTEIIIYTCICVVLRSGTTFYYVAFWVLVNQVYCAYFAHQWALNKFEDFPKSRKIIVPFVY